MLELKVGVMPGKLTEVAVEEGTKVAEIFTLAGIDASSHELRLDGNKVSATDLVQEGRLLVAMKQIKGNAGVLKVGIMPGKLTQINTWDNMTANEAFASAGVDISNHEIRLDGNKIEGNSVVSNGSLLVGMKQIKGNFDGCGECVACQSLSKTYIALEMTTQDVKNILGVELPLIIEQDFVEFVDSLVIVGNGIDMEYVTVDRELFTSIYELVSNEDVIDEPVQMDTPFVQPMVNEMVQPTIQPIDEPVQMDEPTVQPMVKEMVQPIDEQMISLEVVMNNIEEMIYDAEEEENRYRMWMQIAQARKETLLTLADNLMK